MDFKRLILQSLVRALYQAAEKHGIVEKKLQKDTELPFEKREDLRINDLEDAYKNILKNDISNLFMKAVAAKATEEASNLESTLQKYRLEKEVNIQMDWKLVATTVATSLSLGLVTAFSLPETGTLSKMLPVVISTVPPSIAMTWQIKKTTANESNAEQNAKRYYLFDYDLSTLQSDLEEILRTQIPDYIKEKTNEKIKLEQEIEKLKAQIETLREQKEDAELIRDEALGDTRITSFRLKWYTDLSEELRKYWIPVHDISKLVKLVDNIRQYDYDVEKVTNEFSDLERKSLQESIVSLENTNRNLEEHRAGNEVFVNNHRQLINVYNHLEAMKFGTKELWFLRDTVMEIARENDIPSDEAVTKFFSDVERHYNNILGFEPKVRTMRNELNNLYKEEVRVRAELLLLPLVAPKLVKLTQSGVSEQDIINIAAVLEKYFR